MAITIAYTAVSARPRLLTIESHDSSTPSDLAASAPTSPVSEPDSLPSTAGVSIPSTRHRPIRTHSSPIVSSTSQALPMIRRPYPRTPCPSMALSPRELPSRSTDSWTQPPTSRFAPPSSPLYGSCNRSTPSVNRSRPVAPYVSGRDSPRSRSDSGSTVNSQQSTFASKLAVDRRQRGLEMASMDEMVRPQGPEVWHSDRWGGWFKRFWRH